MTRQRPPADLPTPDQPTPDQPTPDQPTPDQPTPDQPTPDQPGSSGDVLAALAGHRVEGSPLPVHQVMARGRRLRRRRMVTLSTVAALSVAAVATSVLAVGPGTILGLATDDAEPAVGEDATCVRMLERQQAEDPETPGAGALGPVPLTAAEVDGLPVLPPTQADGAPVTAMMVNAFEFPCPAPLGVSGARLDRDGLVTGSYLLAGPAAKARIDVWREAFGPETVAVLRTVRLRGTTATVSTVTSESRAPVTRVDWTEHGWSWTFDLALRVGPSTPADTEAALAAVRDLTIADGRVLDERSLPQGFEVHEIWPATPTERSVTWGAEYPVEGSNAVGITVTRFSTGGATAEPASLLAGVTPGDQVVSVHGRTAVWEQGKGVLSWSRSDGAVVSIQVGGYYLATLEHTLRIAETLVPLDEDDPRVREAVDDYLADLRSKGGTVSP